MSSSSPLLPRAARAASLAWLVIPLGLATCFHAWDDYEAPTAGVGDDDDDDSAASITCSRICTAYESCIQADPQCTQICATQLPTCSPGDLSALESCVQILESCSIAADAAWTACLLGVGCYDPQ